jgi:hypothetical protein
LNITLLPAKYGDGIWIEYGTARRRRRIVIDGGPLPAYPELAASFTRLPAGDKRVELFVVSHVDGDHIEAAIRLLAQPRPEWPFLPQDIWFNGYHHMAPRQTLGAREGEFLSALIHARAAAAWNKAFEGGPVTIPPDGTPPRVRLADGMTLTILSPTEAALTRMAKEWKKKLKSFDPGDLERAWEELARERRYHPDSELTLGPGDLTQALREQLKGHDPSAANGSSIAFLAKHRGRSCLLLADAHMDIVCDSIRRLLPRRRTRLEVDAVKLSHHGSKNNLTPELLELVDGQHFLVSTNGDRHDHPDPEAIEAVIAGARRKPTLWFNYRSEFSTRWEKDSKKRGAKYATRYPPDGHEGITLRLSG